MFTLYEKLLQARCSRKMGRRGGADLVQFQGSRSGWASGWSTQAFVVKSLVFRWPRCLRADERQLETKTSYRVREEQEALDDAAT